MDTGYSVLETVKTVDENKLLILFFDLPSNDSIIFNVLTFSGLCLEDEKEKDAGMKLRGLWIADAEAVYFLGCQSS